MSVFDNYIAGEWVAGASVTATSIRRTSPTSSASTRRRTRRRRRAAIAAAKAAFPALVRRARSRSAANILDRAGTEILARKDELGRLLSREEGKTLPEGIGEAMRAGQIFEFFAGEALRARRREAALGAARASTSR